METHPLNLPTSPASSLSPEAAVSLNRLHGNRSEPHHTVQNEQPWHRHAAYLFATGATTAKSVAEACEKSYTTILNLLKQPWFQERVTQLLAENGGKDIMALFKAEAFNSLVTLVEIRDDKTVSPAVRSANCRDILDRHLGKPVQRVETTEQPASNDPVAEVRRLEEQLSREKPAES